jgi:DHA2 family multidrug resistance protein
MTEISKPTLEVAHRGWLTAVIMLATIMQVLDTTIANVALPHMAASLGAGQDEITWVLTSYIVAAAIATPLTGWLADRIGRRELFAAAVLGFTLASLACGVATTLPEMVAFRIIQGLCGAVLAPLAQTVLLDINPREKIGQAMAIYGAGIMVGPIIGPTLGGWLTESFNWRYVFLVNLPVGILALAGVFVFMPKAPLRRRPFDMFGFAMLALAVGALQLLLDRGQSIDWFQATESWIYLGLIVSGIWVFIIHCATAEHPFVDLKMFADRNFTVGMILMFTVGLTLFSGLALLPPLLQNLMGYPVIETGLVMSPRGIGTFASMLVVGRLVGRVDPRLLMIFGLSVTVWSLHMMTGFSLQMDSRLVIVSGVVQGAGLGFVFVPLSALAFATIDAKYRGDGTAMFALVRNVGSGVGISIVTTVLARMLSVNHAELAERLTASAPQVAAHLPGLVSGKPGLVAQVNGLVTQQAAMIAYLDNFYLMMFLTLAAVPIALLLRKPAKAGTAKPDPHQAAAALE